MLRRDAIGWLHQRPAAWVIPRSSAGWAETTVGEGKTGRQGQHYTKNKGEGRPQHARTRIWNRPAHRKQYQYESCREWPPLSHLPRSDLPRTAPRFNAGFSRTSCNYNLVPNLTDLTAPCNILNKHLLTLNPTRSSPSSCRRRGSSRRSPRRRPAQPPTVRTLPPRGA